MLTRASDMVNFGCVLSLFVRLILKFCWENAKKSNNMWSGDHIMANWLEIDITFPSYRYFCVC